MVDNVFVLMPAYNAGATIESATDRRVRFRGHLAPCSFVLGIARSCLLGMHDTCNALDVDCDENLGWRCRRRHESGTSRRQSGSRSRIACLV